MFECKYPLLEVIQAIEKIREAKGPTELEVLDYVRKHVRKPDDPVKVLKTIRTLKKLVEDGVLVQKGKRYMFSQNPPESSGEEEEEECEPEEVMDMEPDECEGGAEQNCEEGGGDEEEEEEDDDDDDDDDEEEDDDDDDSEECDEKEDVPEDDCPKEESEENNNDPSIKTLSKNKNFLSPSKTIQDVTSKVNSNGDVAKCIKSRDKDKKNGTKTVIKNNKAAVIEQKTGDGKNKGGEAIAFCARDFMDSQYRPRSGGSSQVQASKSEEVTEDSIMARAEKMEFGGFQRNSKTARMKRSQLSESNYRSRSPIRGLKPELYGNLRMEQSEEMRSISSQLFQEQVEAEMEVDGAKDGEGMGVGYDVYRHRSPLGPPPPNTPGVHGDREESCCSNYEGKNSTEIKLKADFEEYSLKAMARQLSQVKCKENQGKWSGGDMEKRAEKHKRMQSFDEEKMSDDERASLCSICEKKKRNS